MGCTPAVQSFLACFEDLALRATQQVAGFQRMHPDDVGAGRARIEELAFAGNITATPTAEAANRI